MRKWNYNNYEGGNGTASGRQRQPAEGSYQRGHKGRENSHWKNLENDSLIIEDNTVYEIDLDCVECRQKGRWRP